MATPLVFILPPFKTKAPGIAISASSTATSAITLPPVLSGPATQVRVVNEGPNVAFLAFSKNGSAATLPTANPQITCDAVLAGEDLILTLDPGDQLVSAICRATQTAVLSLYVGVGQ